MENSANIYDPVPCETSLDAVHRNDLAPRLLSRDSVASLDRRPSFTINKIHQDATDTETGVRIQSRTNSKADHGLASVVGGEDNDAPTVAPGSGSRSNSQTYENVTFETREKKSYFNIAFLYIFYSIAFTIVIPAFPALMLDLNGDDSATASYLYGFSVFVRYIIEFFCAPLLGSLTDKYGRKVMLLVSFLVCAAEYALVALEPSIITIFIARVMSGSLDSGIPTSFTIATDIAIYNKDNVTRKYGLLGAMNSIGFIIGPLAGGYLCAYSVTLTFYVAAISSLIGAVLTFFMLEETLPLVKQSKGLQEVEDDEFDTCCIDFKAANPIPALMLHMSNKDLRQLTIPLAFSYLTQGVGFIWYIFMDYKFNSSSAEIGIYLAVYGVVNAVVQGYAIKTIIPAYWNEERASVYGNIMMGLQMAVYGFAPNIYFVYVSMVVFALGTIAEPALKALIVKESLRQENAAFFQGNLQGILCSVRTLCLAFGSLIFSGLFGASINLHPSMPYLCFCFGTILFIITVIMLKRLFTKKGTFYRKENQENMGDYERVSLKDSLLEYEEE